MRKIAVFGVSGRMGQMLVQATDEQPGAVLAAAVERAGHGWIGQDLGQAMGGAARGLVVTDDIDAALAASDVVIDFTAPDATVALAARAAQAGVAHVIGTTGFDDSHLAALAEIATRGHIVRAGNMSLGVNLLVTLARQVASALGAEYDIEIIEAHHRHKVDAPSGTALMLGQAVAEGRGVSLADMADRGRDGMTGARRDGAIGFHAIRGGDFIGEHDVIFAGPGERVTLRHVASDRALFARGALRAAMWLEGRAPGEYSMLDVLGLGGR
ncbi:MAG: dihydrodipicolinate reductase DhpR [Roseibaca calidilacus]|uniref:4-hydroxy-tetrahydrodipicolinate reductase n=1 Tax=Roseibaca calidilacus TaxID=1666912 RepID=A0A0P8ABW4_9RHOB|nr:4-hydroxy-tetrahydrodipicolinate reductase [Roseibaca calidilacus]KPP91678.1 MAG: dihydrodipicolinate reductase DhpR [Roseibaca calidilacus]CUX82704.1 dihydrodipicolinate reductase [Roseibaca calidilacus]